MISFWVVPGAAYLFVFLLQKNEVENRNRRYHTFYFDSISIFTLSIKNFRFDIDSIFRYQKFFDSISIRYFDIEIFSIRYRFDFLMLKIFRFDIDSILWYRKYFDSISIRYFDFKKFRFDIDSIFWNRNFVDSIWIRYSVIENFSIRYRFDILLSK